MLYYLEEFEFSKFTSDESSSNEGKVGSISSKDVIWYEVSPQYVFNFNCLYILSTSSSLTQSPVDSTKSNSCDDDEMVDEKNLSVTPLTKKKRKSYYIRKYPIPKLLKRDIRWDIPKMVTNVLNSHDDRFVNAFFRRVCFSNCIFIDDVPRILGISQEIMYDIDSMINQINLDSFIYPDNVMALKQAQIVQTTQSQGGCRIILQYEMKGTKILTNVFQKESLNTDSESLQQQQEFIPTKFIVPMKSMPPKDTTTNNLSSPPVTVQHVQYTTKDCVPLLQPKKVQMSPKISISLNAENIAYAVEYSLLPGSEIIETTLDTTFQQLSL